MRCLAISSHYTLDTNRLFEYLCQHQDTMRYRRVLHIKTSGDVFYFPYGVIVLWNVDKNEETTLIQQLRDFKGEALGSAAKDTHEYRIGETAAICDDTIVLPDDEPTTKLAFSHALAQSVKLMGMESTIAKTSEHIRTIPQALATRGKIPLSRKKARHLMGQLLLNKSIVNLHTELLNTPQYFWSNPQLEPFYELGSHYIDLGNRVSVLNQRLEVMQSVYDMLTNELANRHSAFLEWIIIGLIALEVILMLRHHS